MRRTICFLAEDTALSFFTCFGKQMDIKLGNILSIGNAFLQDEAKQADNILTVTVCLALSYTL